MDMIGVFLVAIQVVRRFRGIKTVLGQTYGTMLNPPQETEEFKSWEKIDFRINIWGLVFLFVLLSSSVRKQLGGLASSDSQAAAMTIAVPVSTQRKFCTFTRHIDFPPSLLSRQQ